MYAPYGARKRGGIAVQIILSACIYNSPPEPDKVESSRFPLCSGCPYPRHGLFYDGVVFGLEDHIRLRDLLLSIKGKFLLSYNDCPEVRELYGGRGLFIEEVSRLDNPRQFAVAGSTYPELLISNYDPKLAETLPLQMGLFDLQEGLF
jgi:hypothetical protein